MGRARPPLPVGRPGAARHRRRAPCGRTFARLEGGILGRVDDMLVVRGINVFPSALEGIVRRFALVDEFQIEVFRRGVLDEVRLLLEIDGNGTVRRRACGRPSTGSPRRSGATSGSASR